MNNLCTCGSSQIVEECCNAIVTGKRDALSAEELMRSRYYAFTKADIDYLMLSHHSETRQVKDKKSILEWAKSVKWMGLTILKTTAGKAADETGYVEFRALYLENGQLEQIHENSFFKRENGKWVYVSGVHL